MAWPTKTTRLQKVTPTTVPSTVKKARCNELLALQLRHQQAWFATLHGSVQQVLVEGPSRSDDGAVWLAATPETAARLAGAMTRSTLTVSLVGS